MDAEIYADDTLGGRLLSAREGAGLSLVTVAEQLGVDPSSLRNWECDRSEPSIDRLVRLAAILNVRPFWLITGDTEGDCAESERNATDRVMAINRVGRSRQRDGGERSSADRLSDIVASNRTLQ
ncbi:helix-turn-helix domain-containing protein [Martelella limonii]|uniref:helix-turn-helix domain-containing protein n=1 Tax=Martelella limonii TaxID=1647649 RepID=UPI00157FEF03|nr:helix-turn-helix transcriptional regulator [Martelella limonii]